MREVFFFVFNRTSEKVVVGCWFFHGKLMYKFQQFGLLDSLHALLKYYLRDRVLFVQCRSFRSNTFSRLSGVPLGSLFGPLFFVAYFNHIVDIMYRELDIWCWYANTVLCLSLWKTAEYYKEIFKHSMMPDVYLT